MTAAEWRALEARLEWSPAHGAFVLHAEPIHDPPAGEAPADAKPTSTRSLRPDGFDDFIGQRTVVDGLLLAGRAALERGEPLGHVLLAGGAGLGKTSLCRLLAREFGSSITEVAAGNLGDGPQLVSQLVRMGDRGYYFIDEVHRLGAVCEEWLYSAMEDGKVSVPLREGARSRTIRIRLAPFTLVAATTHEGALSEPFRGRFKHLERLEPYAEDEIAELTARAARRLGTAVSAEAALEVARRSRGTPREAIRILERARDEAQLEKAAEIGVSHVGHASQRLGIDEHGLDRVGRAVVTLLLRRRRAMGREAIAARLGLDPETYRDVYEPFLERSGLIERSELGRVATAKAIALYGEAA
jgi:Holliday junction DNA helicase RuvB